jgi:hypothetical protein
MVGRDDSSVHMHTPHLQLHLQPDDMVVRTTCEQRVVHQLERVLHQLYGDGT